MRKASHEMYSIMSQVNVHNALLCIYHVVVGEHYVQLIHTAAQGSQWYIKLTTAIQLY